MLWHAETGWDMIYRCSKRQTMFPSVYLLQSIWTGSSLCGAAGAGGDGGGGDGGG